MRWLTLLLFVQLAVSIPGHRAGGRPDRETDDEQPSSEIAFDDFSDDAILEFVRQRSKAERVTRHRVFMDLATAKTCKMPLAPSVDSGPHQFKAVHVYVNRDAFAPMWDPFESFPVGSLIVKEKVDGFEPDNTELFTGMIKRESGYAPEVGDWEFFTVDGNASEVTARGKLESCIACHTEYADSDFVTKSYAARALPPFQAKGRFVELSDGDAVESNQPTCWTAGDVLILPASWAMPAGEKLTRSEAEEKWRQENAEEESLPDDLSGLGGPRLRYEPSEAKNTLRYWTEVNDSAVGKFKLMMLGRSTSKCSKDVERGKVARRSRCLLTIKFCRSRLKTQDISRTLFGNRLVRLR
ncbi:MAG: cytochrome P460 family protein [Pirellulaceae bacterium]